MFRGQPEAGCRARSRLLRRQAMQTHTEGTVMLHRTPSLRLVKRSCWDWVARKLRLAALFRMPDMRRHMDLPGVAGLVIPKRRCWRRMVTRQRSSSAVTTATSVRTATPWASQRNFARTVGNQARKGFQGKRENGRGGPHTRERATLPRSAVAFTRPRARYRVLLDSPGNLSGTGSR